MESATDLILDMCTNGGCDPGCDTSGLVDNITTSFNYTLCVNNSSDTIHDYTSSSIPPDEWLDPSYYSLPYRIIGTIFQGIILIVGQYLTIFHVIKKN